MLPGEDFGFESNEMLSRIAFVDFDGNKALSKFSSLIKSDRNMVIKKLFPNIYKGVDSLLNWLMK